MTYPPVLQRRFYDRLTVEVRHDVREATRRDAQVLGLTVADYARLALAERLTEDGQQITPMPILSIDRLDGVTTRSAR